MIDNLPIGTTLDANLTDAIGYLRVSTESQIDGFGLPVQRSAVIALAAAEGYNLVGIYTDEGVSGSEDVAGRAGLAHALDDLAAGTAAVLIIPRLDRLARDLMVQESILADAWRAGATVVTCSETERAYCKPDSPDDPARTLIRQVLGAVAAYERNMIRMRLVAGRRRRIERDGYAGGPQPYGWTDQSERDVLAHVAASRRHGRAWKAIADELNRAGKVRRNGGAWTSSELHRTFTRASDRGAIIEPMSMNLTPSLL